MCNLKYRNTTSIYGTDLSTAGTTNNYFQLPHTYNEGLIRIAFYNINTPE